MHVLLDISYMHDIELCTVQQCSSIYRLRGGVPPLNWRCVEKRNSGIVTYRQFHIVSFGTLEYHYHRCSEFDRLHCKARFQSGSH